MAIERINTFAIQQSLQNGTNKTMANLLDMQKQLSSGFSADSYAELGGTQTQVLSTLTTKMQRTQTYVDNNVLLTSRLQTTNQALSNISDIATDISNAISQRRNGATGTSFPFTQQLQGFQQALSGALNTNSEGRYLFSGSSTNTPAVKTTIPDPANVGTPDAGYYQGGTQDVTTLIQDGYPLTYNVRADNPAFQKMYAAIAQAVKADATNDQASLTSAFALIQDSIKGVTALQGQTNSNIVTVQDASTQLQSFKIYWQNTTDSISKTDITSVSTQISLDESTLTASFQAYASISKLHLTDYLR